MKFDFYIIQTIFNEQDERNFDNQTETMRSYPTLDTLQNAKDSLSQYHFRRTHERNKNYQLRKN